MEAHHIQLQKSMMGDEKTLAMQFKHFFGRQGQGGRYFETGHFGHLWDKNECHHWFHYNIKHDPQFVATSMAHTTTFQSTTSMCSLQGSTKPQCKQVMYVE